MPDADLTRELVVRLERLGLDYFITGSVAAAVYGEYRFTYDIDIVLILRMGEVDRFCAEFTKSLFAVDRYSIELAIENDDMFNMLYLPTGEKVDVMLPEDSDFNESRFTRKRRIEIEEGVTASVACPEHIILKKMQFFQMGASEKHLRDITSILLIQGDAMDRAYIELMAGRMGVSSVWDAILEKIKNAGYQ